MTFLAAALPYISAAGTVLSTLNTIQQGRAANASAKFQAAQAERQAGQARATAQREALQEKHKAVLVGSRAKALAAANGGSADDPSALNILSDIEGQGEYNALSALYNGEERAIGLETSASARRLEGKQAQKAGFIKAGTTLLGSIGGSSLLSKYSPTGGAWKNPDAGEYSY